MVQGEAVIRSTAKAAERHSTSTPIIPNLIDHRFVDSSLNALKFDAAASFQLPQKHVIGCEHVSSTIPERLLVVSPYTTSSHLLDLSSVSKPNQLLATALTSLKPIRDDYATAPYIEAFNWSAVIENLKTLVGFETGFYWQKQTFYVVIFRSRIPPETDRSHLGSLDQDSHLDAMQSGGLLKYWFGEPDKLGRNLATCASQLYYLFGSTPLTEIGIWREQADARGGSRGSGHRRAVEATSKLYTEWKVERMKLVVGDGVEQWDLVEWKA